MYLKCNSKVAKRLIVVCKLKVDVIVSIKYIQSNMQSRFLKYYVMCVI